MNIQSGLNCRPAFGMKIVVPEEVHNQFISSTDGFAERGNKALCSSERARSPWTQKRAETTINGILLDTYKKIAEHNANPVNHCVYDDTITIKKMEITPFNSFDFKFNVTTDSGNVIEYDSYHDNADLLVKKIQDSEINEKEAGKTITQNIKAVLQKILPSNVEQKSDLTIHTKAISC